MSKVLIYGDISPNVIDGSSIWLLSITETLSQVFEEAHLVTKMPVEDETLLGHLWDSSTVKVHQPSKVLDVQDATVFVEEIAATEEVNAVFARGFDVCNEFCQNPTIAPLLWAYVTDLPFPPSRLSKNSLNRLNRVSDRSYRLLAQTEASRSYLEELVPSAAGRVHIMNPIIPDSAFELAKVKETNATRSGDDRPPLRIVYSGKFAEDWKTLEMLDLPSKLSELGISSVLEVVGNKFNRSASDPDWVSKMRSKLESYSSDPLKSVIWHGSVSRERSLAIIRDADIGLGWRTSRLDSSMEISTKALEYGAVCIAPIVNRTADHISLYGEAYPFFSSANDSVGDLAQRIASNLDQIVPASRKARKISESYSMSATVKRLRNYMQRSRVLPGHTYETARPKSPSKVLVVSHDFKFMGELLGGLNSAADFEVRQDNWKTLHEHNKQESKRLSQWADIVFCEFAGPNLAWYSTNKQPGSKLFSRLHGFELRGGKWLDNVNWNAVDGLVVVSEFYRELALSRLPIPENKIHVIPNMIDCADLDRPKSKDARFHLGVVGYVPFLKRPDRAVQVLAEILKHDPRYVLHFKGRLPWEYPYVWNNPIQRRQYLEVFSAVAQNPQLRSHIVFDPFGADIGTWLRNIGCVLSTSDHESFHLAPAEALASGAATVVWRREGAKEIFGEERLVDNAKAAAVRILDLTRFANRFEEAARSSRTYAARWDKENVLTYWVKLFKNEIQGEAPGLR